MMGSLIDVAGIRVGSATDEKALTGCTVILAEDGAVAGVDVRGAAPGTRETDLLQPVRLVDKIQAILLSGGSAFGLDAAAGVMGYLENKGKGVQVGPFTVPLVPAAVIFDLYTGKSNFRPDREMGYRACKEASDAMVPEGSIGAGAGATTGKIKGPLSATKTGQGTASRRLGDLVVASLVVVNAFGDVFNRGGEQIAGPVNSTQNGFYNTANLIIGGDTPQRETFNTTLGVIATNAALNKEGANKVAQMAHDGLARCIWPVHTLWDGDTIFTLSLGEKNANWNLVGVLAAEVVIDAVERAVTEAKSWAGFPSYKEILKHKEM